MKKILIITLCVLCSNILMAKDTKKTSDIINNILSDSPGKKSKVKATTNENATTSKAALNQ